MLVSRHSLARLRPMKTLSALSYLDVADPGFSTRGPEVAAARAEHWAARTPYGMAVLRYREMGQMLRDRRFRQGSHNWPDVHGLTGSFARFWKNSVIGHEGDAHRTLRTLCVPALSPDFIAQMRPAFAEIAQTLCADLRPHTACEFQNAFANPFAGQAITTLLGMDRRDWQDVSHDATELGLAMGVQSKTHEARFNAACTRLQDLARDLVARVRKGRDQTSYVARLVARHRDLPDLDEQALLDMIVISIFGGVDTTRAQLGLGLGLFIEHPDQ